MGSRGWDPSEEKNSSLTSLKAHRWYVRLKLLWLEKSIVIANKTRVESPI